MGKRLVCGGWQPHTPLPSPGWSQGSPFIHPRDKDRDWWKDQQVQGSQCVARSEVKDLLMAALEVLIWWGR